MHPYCSLDERSFWAPAVAQRSMYDIDDLWDPKFRVGPNMPVATYGSCFAQHIGRALTGRGFRWVNTEPAPDGLSAENAKRYNYGVFSSRTGNIYTTSLLGQWVDWATGQKQVPDEIWQKDGRFYDPFRPNIEPGGFRTAEEMVRSRQAAIGAFRQSLVTARVLVFTLGLTESWFNRRHGYEYPMCPGTVAGEFDEASHQFVNQDFPNIKRALIDTLRRIKAVNENIRVLLTVSPVPLTATMSGNHVLVATMESKSILRAVAGAVQRQLQFVDYFPSYEIINSSPFRGVFFEPNQRSVNPVGVEHVMKIFFASLSAKFGDVVKASAGKGGAPVRPRRGRQSNQDSRAKSEDVVCEEELLGAFAQ